MESAPLAVAATSMLRQVEQTAAAVLNLFPDLDLAMEEGEPRLALDCFNLVQLQYKRVCVGVVSLLALILTTVTVTCTICST